MIPALDPELVAAEAHRRWSASCPRCAQRRVLWPIGQNVNTGYEKHARWVHVGGVECTEP